MARNACSAVAAIAGELRVLRVEQERERLAGRDALDFVGGPLGGARVAGADRDQPARDREIAAHAAAVAAETSRSDRASAGWSRTIDQSSSATSDDDARARPRRTITEVSIR